MAVILLHRLNKLGKVEPTDLVVGNTACDEYIKRKLHKKHFNAYGNGLAIVLLIVPNIVETPTQYRATSNSV
jgi:hypothetical protein